MHLLSILLLLLPVASLPEGVPFDLDQVRPMNGGLCLRYRVDKGGLRSAPLGNWLVTRSGWFSGHPISFYQRRFAELGRSVCRIGSSGEKGLNRGQI